MKTIVVSLTALTTNETGSKRTTVYRAERKCTLSPKMVC